MDKQDMAKAIQDAQRLIKYYEEETKRINEKLRLEKEKLKLYSDLIESKV